MKKGHEIDSQHLKVSDGSTTDETMDRTNKNQINVAFEVMKMTIIAAFHQQ